jgi:hypothetical protein
MQLLPTAPAQALLRARAPTRAGALGQARARKVQQRRAQMLSSSSKNAAFHTTFAKWSKTRKLVLGLADGNFACWDLESNETFISRKHFAGKHKNAITCGAWGFGGDILALGSKNQIKVSEPLLNASWEATSAKLELLDNEHIASRVRVCEIFTWQLHLLHCLPFRPDLACWQHGRIGVLSAPVLLQRRLLQHQWGKRFLLVRAVRRQLLLPQWRNLLHCLHCGLDFTSWVFQLVCMHGSQCCRRLLQCWSVQSFGRQQLLRLPALPPKHLHLRLQLCRQLYCLPL